MSGADGGAPAPVRWDPALLWILGGALAIRLGVLFVVSPTPLAGDELDYFWRAAERAQDMVPEDVGFRPPLMEFFYGTLFRLTGPSIPVARLATVVIGVLLLVPLHDIARRFGGLTTARMAAVLAAVYPNFIAFSHYLWSETIYMFLVLWGIALLGSHLERPAIWKLGLAGVALGLSALTRVVGLAFPILAAGWLLWISRSELRRSLRPLAAPACLLVAVVVPIAPWTASLNREGEPFAVITRTTWHNLYLGNVQPPDRHPVMGYRQLGDTTTERETKARTIVLETIWDRLPGWPFEKIASELPSFFGPKSFAVRRLQTLGDLTGSLNRAWGYRFRFHEVDTRSFRSRAGVLTVCTYIAIVLLGTVGMALMPPSRWRQLLLIFVLSQLAPTILTFAISRFRLAAMTVAIIGTAWLIRTGPDAWRDASRAARVTALATASTVAWMISLRWQLLSTHAWG